MLRRTFLIALVLVTPRLSAAQDRGSASFVSGFSVAQGSTIGSAVSSVAGLSGASSNLNFGGRVAFNLAPGFQAVGEVGRLGNILPPLTTSLLAFSPVQIRARAFYEEGGVRAFAAPHGSVNPYVEATGGMAHLSLRVAGLNATADDLLRLGLGFTSRTSPMAGLGAGVMFNSGPVTLDAGYRYKKIFSKDFVGTLLSGGSGELTSHQVAFGVGVRF
jgi:opacity protein-like surface antigen